MATSNIQLKDKDGNLLYPRTTYDMVEGLISRFGRIWAEDEWVSGYYDNSGTLKTNASYKALKIDVSQINGSKVYVTARTGATAPLAWVDAQGNITLATTSAQTLNNAEYTIPTGTKFLFVSNDIRITASGYNVTFKADTETPFNGLKFVAMGDSITSTYVSKIGDVIPTYLGCDLAGNFGVGNATGGDSSSNGVNNTVISFEENPSSDLTKNTLSNQVRRLLQKTTAEGEQITWTHPVDGAFSIDTSVGVGTGELTAPDIIYLAFGINDAKSYAKYMNIQETDIPDILYNQTYSELTRINLVSGMRWAIETLQSAYPNAQIFVASPLQCNQMLSATVQRNYYGAIAGRWLKEVCYACGAHYIDAHQDSGFVRIYASQNGDGVHPNSTWRQYIASYVAEEIKKQYNFRPVI